MIKIFKYLKPKEWLMASICLIFIVIQVWLDLKIPDYMAEVTKLTQTPGSAISDIWQHGGYMLLCALGSFMSAVAVGYFAAKIASRFSQRLRSLLFNKVESFSMEEINLFSTSSLITRSTNDITQIQMLVVLGLQLVIKAPITAAWAITKIAGKGFEWVHGHRRWFFDSTHHGHCFNDLRDAEIQKNADPYRQHNLRNQRKSHQASCGSRLQCGSIPNKKV